MAPAQLREGWLGILSDLMVREPIGVEIARDPWPPVPEIGIDGMKRAKRALSGIDLIGMTEDLVSYEDHRIVYRVGRIAELSDICLTNALAPLGSRIDRISHTIFRLSFAIYLRRHCIFHYLIDRWIRLTKGSNTRICWLEEALAEAYAYVSHQADCYLAIGYELYDPGVAKDRSDSMRAWYEKESGTGIVGMLWELFWPSYNIVSRWRLYWRRWHRIAEIARSAFISGLRPEPYSLSRRFLKCFERLFDGISRGGRGYRGLKPLIWLYNDIERGQGPGYIDGRAYEAPSSKEGFSLFLSNLREDSGPLELILPWPSEEAFDG